MSHAEIATTACAVAPDRARNAATTRCRRRAGAELVALLSHRDPHYQTEQPPRGFFASKRRYSNTRFP
jgi:hypothetical protein